MLQIVSSNNYTRDILELNVLITWGHLMLFYRYISFGLLKYLSLLVLALILGACASGNDSGSPASLSWVAPSEREDGTALALSEISGYRIYYGTETASYHNHFDINDGSAEEAQFTNIPPGTYYVVVTSLDVDGRESEYSSEVVVAL